MREAIDIVVGFDLLVADRMPMALATIVAAEGSSYRRPGARMLIAADGRRFGTISGGCLEADVARRGHSVIDTGKPVLCRYETTEDSEESLSLDEDPIDRDPGARLGCGGALEILITPVTAQKPGAIDNVRRALFCNQTSRTATVYRTGGNIDTPIGTTYKLPSSGNACGPFSSDDLVAGDGFHRVKLLGGWMDVFIESFCPPPHLMVFGDGPDVIPLLELARMQGWRTTVCGYRRRTDWPCDRFVLVKDHEEVSLTIDPAAGTVVMTHDLLRDARLLRRLAHARPAYVGVLGPNHRTQRLLAAAAIDPATFGGRFFGPIGLDLGGEGPQRVALSIVAEVAAVLSRHAGGHLRDKRASIHHAPDVYATSALTA